MGDFSLTRRTVIASISGYMATHMFGCASKDRDDYSKVDAFIKKTLQSGDTPGIAACAVRGDQIEWSAGYGWADIAARKPMTPDTIQNIASVSKTITATAIMQLREEEKLDLDVDVNEYLPFPVRNPRYPSTPITIRQLLTHTSSITDGPAYEPSYACGDPTMSLNDWLQAYFDPAGSNYDTEGNFLSWRPGTLDLPAKADAYSNLAFGLLGGLVETITERPFSEYCRHRIFEPLSMKNTGWYLTDIDETKHAIPYGSANVPRLSASSDRNNDTDDSEYHPHCLYSFTNYPDGLIRTSVNDLSRFLRAYIGSGTFQTTRILDESTIEKMLTVSHDRQGLCWRTARHVANDNTIWGHGGGDPGVSTTMDFNQRDQVGVIVFSNFDGWDLVRQVSKKLFEASTAI
jgi:CubicO group peptidase (beta-lactamase class C family)